MCSTTTPRVPVPSRVRALAAAARRMLGAGGQRSGQDARDPEPRRLAAIRKFHRHEQQLKPAYKHWGYKNVFAKGFIGIRGVEPELPRERWQRLTLDDWHFAIDPELEHRQAVGERCAVLILGHAFAPATDAPGGTARSDADARRATVASRRDAVAGNLVAAARADLAAGASRTRVDELVTWLSGRFVAFVLRGEELDVYGDPMATRACYYLDQGNIRVAAPVTAPAPSDGPFAHTTTIPHPNLPGSAQTPEHLRALAPAVASHTALLADLVAAARTSQLPGRGEFAYSNLGAALLGHALARATGAEDWAALVQDRLLDPLGMADTRIDLASPAPDVLQPHQANGRVNEPWNGAGYAPAGLGVTTTADDLVRYATAILDGTAPGLDALGERWPTNMGELRVGLAWMDAGGITWHNGGTGGTRTMLAIDREAGAAAIVLTNTEHDVTGAGLVLLGADAAALPGPPPIDPDTIGWVVAGLLAVGLFGWGAVRSRSRVRLIGQGLGAVGSLLIWGIAAPWYWAPLRLFGLVVGLTIASIIVAVRRWRELPWWPERRRWAAATLAIAGVLWFVFTVAVSIWVLVLLLG